MYAGTIDTLFGVTLVCTLSHATLQQQRVATSGRTRNQTPYNELFYELKLVSFHSIHAPCPGILPESMVL